MNDYERRKARLRDLVAHAAAIRDEALAFGRSWRGFVPALRLVIALETEARSLSLSFAH